MYLGYYHRICLSVDLAAVSGEDTHKHEEDDTDHASAVRHTNKHSHNNHTAAGVSLPGLSPLASSPPRAVSSQVENLALQPENHVLAALMACHPVLIG